MHEGGAFGSIFSFITTYIYDISVHTLSTCRFASPVPAPRGSLPWAVAHAYMYSTCIQFNESFFGIFLNIIERSFFFVSFFSLFLFVSAVGK